MKRAQTYLMFFLFVAVFGIMVTCAVPNSTAYYIGHGSSNILIYGAIGYSVVAVLREEYKRLWNALLMLILAVVLPSPILNLLSY